MKKIMLDPGHGGKDSGALGGGWLEKDVNLEAAKYIGLRLTALGFTVGYTRTDDVYNGDLEGRGKSANGYDYFLSIHCNAGGGSGAEVYCNTRETFAYTEIALRDEIGTRLGWRKIASRRYDTAEFGDRTVDEATRKFTGVVQASDWYGVLRGCWSVGVSGDLLEMFFIDSAMDRGIFDADRAGFYETVVKALCTAFGAAYKAPEAAAPTEESPQEPDCQQLAEQLAAAQAAAERDMAQAKLAAIQNLIGS
jgi:N-acetylmuramoyl-L-alanine amidase